MNEAQAKRYAEVLEDVLKTPEAKAGWAPAEKLSYIAIGSEESPDDVHSICPVILNYADILCTMIGAGATRSLWGTGVFQRVFDTRDEAEDENKPLLQRRCVMMVAFLNNCLSRAAEAIPPGENDGCARHEVLLNELLFRSGAQAAGMTLGVIRSLKLFEATDEIIKRWDDVAAARWYKNDELDLEDPFAELRRGSLWLLEEMCALKA